MSALSVQNLSKSFGDLAAVSNLSLSINDHAFATLLGPSGSGKSTVLRLIAGLEAADSGTIHINGQDVTSLQPHHRPCTMVFQRYALFPHLNVFENVEFGLRRHGVPEADRRSRVMDALELVGLTSRSRSKPHELSGGQEQRVALARALVVQPAVLLLDEPLAALDAAHRKRMQLELKSIQQQTGITFLSVTHDQEEALSMSDWIGVLHNGNLEQWGTPNQIFTQPANRFVAEFMGAENLIPLGKVRQWLGGAIDSFRDRPDNELLVVRPESIRLTSDGLPASVVSTSYKGSTLAVVLRLTDGTTLTASLPGSVPPPETGSAVAITLDTSHAVTVPDA